MDQNPPRSRGGDSLDDTQRRRAATKKKRKGIEDKQRAEGQRRRPREDPDRARDVSLRGRAAIAEAIRAALGQCEAERSRHGGDRQSGVGARRARAVAPQHTHGRARVLTSDGGADDERRRGEPRGDEVQRIVETRSDLAEPLERAVAITDHRVGGVTRAIRGGPRRARRPSTPPDAAGSADPRTADRAQPRRRAPPRRQRPNRTLKPARTPKSGAAPARLVDTAVSSAKSRVSRQMTPVCTLSPS